MKVSPPRLPARLTEATDFATQVLDDISLSGLSVTNDDISHLVVRDLAVSESRLERVNIAEATLEKTSLLDVELSGCNLTATKLSEASWQRTRIKNSRCSGVQLPMAILKDIIFSHCLLRLSNFRFATLQNVRFEDCLLDEADFYASRLTNVVFDNCSLNKTAFYNGKYKKVDLRTSDISNIFGVDSLSGMIIDSIQLTILAPVLAQQLGVTVLDS